MNGVCRALGGRERSPRTFSLRSMSDLGLGGWSQALLAARPCVRGWSQALLAARPCVRADFCPFYLLHPAVSGIQHFSAEPKTALKAGNCVMCWQNTHLAHAKLEVLPPCISHRRRDSQPSASKIFRQGPNPTDSEGQSYYARAKDEIRTRDIHLGKVELYH